MKRNIHWVGQPGNYRSFKKSTIIKTAIVEVSGSPSGLYWLESWCACLFLTPSLPTSYHTGSLTLPCGEYLHHWTPTSNTTNQAPPAHLESWLLNIYHHTTGQPSLRSTLNNKWLTNSNAVITRSTQKRNTDKKYYKNTITLCIYIFRTQG